MKIDPNQPAFPWEDTKDTAGLPRPSPGLTVRAHLAAMAMQGLLANVDYAPAFDAENQASDAATDALKFADALIAELNKEALKQ